MSKIELSDSGIDSLCDYLMTDGLQIIDLDLSYNNLNDMCLSKLSDALKVRGTVKYLNLGNNYVKDKGIINFCDMLCQKNC